MLGVQLKENPRLRYTGSEPLVWVPKQGRRSVTVAAGAEQSRRASLEGENSSTAARGGEHTPALKPGAVQWTWWDRGEGMRCNCRTMARSSPITFVKHGSLQSQRRHTGALLLPAKQRTRMSSYHARCSNFRQKPWFPLSAFRASPTLGGAPAPFYSDRAEGAF